MGLEEHNVYAYGDVIASVMSRKTSAEGRVLQISVTPPDGGCHLFIYLFIYFYFFTHLFIYSFIYSCVFMYILYVHVMHAHVIAGACMCSK